jgi:outer membrane protein OmpA-like peptidoglycan-associated protein
MIASLALQTLSSIPASALTPVPVSATIFFEKDSAELTESSRKMLVGVASYIRYNGAACINVRISGHLDRAEAKTGNGSRIDLKRAANVRDFLRAVPVLEGYAFDIFAYGGDRPTMLNTPDDEPKNRRVDINWECVPARRQ